MATATRMTLQEFLALPEEKPYLEFVNGEVWEKPMPGQEHSDIVAELTRLLGNYLVASRAGRVGTELRHVEDDLEDRVYLPGVSVTLTSRLPAVRKGPSYIHPDIAIEVLSPDDRANRVLNKVAFYLRVGVSLVWVIDPELETVTVYRRGAEAEELSGSATLFAAPLLPGFELALPDLFAVLHDSPAE
jgi:Uma2 family endonuclease